MVEMLKNKNITNYWNTVPDVVDEGDVGVPEGQAPVPVPVVT